MRTADRTAATERTPTPPTGSGPLDTGEVLRAVGVVKSFRRGLWPRRRTVPVLRGASLSLHAGEVVGLVGENGSGKSTLMQVLVGLLPADSGTVSHSGRLGYCPQQPQLYPRLTCDEHVDLFGHAYRLSPREAARSRADLYDTLDFSRYAHSRVDQLSGGTAAKLNLALALLADPEVLLLDEPYAGFDWSTYLRFWDLVAERQLRGRSVLVISHFVVDEQRFDRILDLVDGVLVDRAAGAGPVGTQAAEPAGGAGSRRMAGRPAGR